MTDLLKSVKQETEIDLSLIKINIIAFIGILFSVGFSFFLNKLFQSNGAVSLNASLIILFGTLFLVVVFLQSILIKDLKRVAAIIFLQTIGLLVSFIFLLNGFILVGFIITFLLLFWGSSSCKKELEYSMKIRIFRISKFVLPKAITGLTIFIVASYLGAFQSTELKISLESFKRIVLPVESIANIVFPEFSLEDNFTNMYLKINPKFNGVSLQDLPKDEQKGFIIQQQESIAKILNYEFEVTDSTLNILYNAYAQNISLVSDNNKLLILFILGAILFLLVRSIGTPLSWFVALVAAIIYEILLTFGFATVVLETRSREIILLK